MKYKLLAQQLGWEHEPFEIPEQISAEWNNYEEGNSLNTQWDDLMSEYSKVYPAEHALLQRLMANELPEDFTRSFETFLENLQTGEKKRCCNQKSF